MKTHRMKWIWAAPCTVQVWAVEEHVKSENTPQAKHQIVTVLAKTAQEAAGIVGETEFRKIVAIQKVATPTDLGNERYRIARSNVAGLPESFVRPKKPKDAP